MRHYDKNRNEIKPPKIKPPAPHGPPPLIMNKRAIEEKDFIISELGAYIKKLTTENRELKKILITNDIQYRTCIHCGCIAEYPEKWGVHVDLDGSSELICFSCSEYKGNSK